MSRRVLRAAFERLPAAARADLRRCRATFLGLDQLKRNQAMFASRLSDLEAGAGPGPPIPSPVVDRRFPTAITSRLCTQAQLGEAWYRMWCEALGEPARAHRKLWEHAYIAHVLDALGQLRPGRTGLGFGVGREPLVALFAGRGCAIVATDLPDDSEEARLWSNTRQHAGGIGRTADPDLCDREQFQKLVTWRPVDMRSVPDDLAAFDFCWSACSFEHLGSLDAGLGFVESSLRTLRPGGIAVHTTEYNLGSDGATIESGSTVLYRRQDLEGLAVRLEAQGHQVAALDLHPGTGVLDEYVDVPPYVDEPHLRLWYRSFTTTSVALVIRAAS